jgi:hypothetical protein
VKPAAILVVPVPAIEDREVYGAPVACPARFQKT